LPEAVYPATKEVSPSARLALLGIYGLIVVAVPGAAAYLWRRRRGGGEPLLAGHGPAHLGDPGRGDLADAAAPTLSLPDPGPDRSSVIGDPAAGSAFGAAPTAGPAKSALGVPAAAVLAAGSLKGRIARAAHFPVAPEATEVPESSSVNGQVAEAGGTKTPVVADAPELAATAAVAASAAEQPRVPQVTTPKAVTSRKRAGPTATPAVEAAAAQSASDGPTVANQTKRVAATTVTKSRRRQRAKTIASTSDLSNDPSSVAPASDPGGTAARKTRRTPSPRPAEPSTTAAITPPTVPETAPVTEPSNTPDAAIEPSAMPEVVAPATDHSTSPKRPSTRRPRRTTEAEP